MTKPTPEEWKQVVADAIARGWAKPGKPYCNPNFAADKHALRQKRIRYCICGNMAVKRDRGDWVCARCVSIEKRYLTDFQLATGKRKDETRQYQDNGEAPEVYMRPQGQRSPRLGQA